ncbi:hypothetical protein BO70DRAFT_80393 [Aspergillus heteromorphus CBS 117.55]|uniref:Uncharacterized protein n=1 Tax=Aspergillus heteromorphus CBS 117.55 TaxID=1448321 RepID=A0A317WWZ1_9EURO|nr:uncharacterized protein BO70DRAFT_80393 [Aspergillus heteromorphus CBS 117.55]PWY90863.1 hypothetical protein BO70DRAFT_80393 [Aspergillus heteromorphus CBS 117.55]
MCDVFRPVLSPAQFFSPPKQLRYRRWRIDWVGFSVSLKKKAIGRARLNCLGGVFCPTPCCYALVMQDDITNPTTTS